MQGVVPLTDLVLGQRGRLDLFDDQWFMGGTQPIDPAPDFQRRPLPIHPTGDLHFGLVATQPRTGARIWPRVPAWARSRF